MTANELKISRLTFKAEIAVTVEFIAQPNVPGITDDSDDPISSGFCYGCHQAHHIQGDPNNVWRKEGAAPIYGDQINGQTNSSHRKNHHPMGTEAKLTNTKFLRAPGVEANLYLNQSNELTCTSCHADLHGVIDGKDYDQSKENNFLRWEFTQDNAEFCIKCHSDKHMGNNLIVFDGKHFWDTDSPLSREVFDKNAAQFVKSISCKQCMFCHFIHDGEERDNEGTSGSIRADIDSLMRVGPLNLAWGDRAGDNDLADYEDMCYGCHGNEDIVKNQDFGLDALLLPDSYFTHRFASPPDPNSPTKRNVLPGSDVFPLPDGTENETIDDYGAEAGNIYCGSCHNVHAQYESQSPYLNSGKSPYVADGFCEACHDDDSDDFVLNSHPIAKGPNNEPSLGSPTVPTFPDLYTTWTTGNPSSGKPGGIVTDAGEVICLTCHNTHAAVTSWDGKTATEKTLYFHGQILVKDNYVRQINPAGSEMCKDCHASVANGNELFPEGPHGAGANFAGNEYEDGRKMGICNACHSPHHRLGPKIWSRSGYNAGPFPTALLYLS
jgi:hypothetical protein